MEDVESYPCENNCMILVNKAIKNEWHIIPGAEATQLLFWFTLSNKTAIIIYAYYALELWLV